MLSLEFRKPRNEKNENIKLNVLLPYLFLFEIILNMSSFFLFYIGDT